MFYHVMVMLEEKEKNKNKTLSKIDMNEEEWETIKSKIKNLWKENKEINFSGRSLLKKDVKELLIKSSEKSAEETCKIKENQRKNTPKIPNVIIFNTFVWTEEAIVKNKEFGKDITDVVLDSFEN